MTARLYDVRIDAYPKVMQITEGLRKSSLEEQGDDISEEYFKNILKQIDEWHATKAAFIISRNSLHQLYTLRDSLREKPESGSRYSAEQINRIWSAKGAFRAALREDIQLVFKEEGEGNNEG